MLTNKSIINLRNGEGMVKAIQKLILKKKVYAYKFNGGIGEYQAEKLHTSELTGLWRSNLLANLDIKYPLNFVVKLLNLYENLSLIISLKK